MGQRGRGRWEMGRAGGQGAMKPSSPGSPFPGHLSDGFHRGEPSVHSPASQMSLFEDCVVILSSRLI